MKQFGMIKGLVETGLDDEGTMVRQFGMMAVQW